MDELLGFSESSDPFEGAPASSGCKGCHLLVTFNVGTTADEIATQLQQLEKVADRVVHNCRLKKRIMYVAIESLQNIMIHGVKDKRHTDSKLVLGESDAGFSLLVSNTISNKQIAGLEERLNHINRLSECEVKAVFRTSLQRCDMRATGGVELGLYRIAQKCSSKMTYVFRSVDPGHSRFILRVDLAK